jgi:hypothetical protein
MQVSRQAALLLPELFDLANRLVVKIALQAFEDENATRWRPRLKRLMARHVETARRELLRCFEGAGAARSKGGEPLA